MNFNDCHLKPLTEQAAAEISEWEWNKPYDVYHFKGRPNGYLWDRKTWGIEQFYLDGKGTAVGLVSCQFDQNQLWVGWAFSPELCGKGKGHLFIETCIREIRKIKNYKGKLYLRVAASDARAIKAYQKAGFVYFKTIPDEIAYSNHTEDFWIMTKDDISPSSVAQI